MAEIVNLRQARKHKRRDEKERSAAENRRAHGRTGAEKKSADLAKKLDDKRLSQHRRERADPAES
jgi:hypothetical protein